MKQKGQNGTKRTKDEQQRIQMISKIYQVHPI